MAERAKILAGVMFLALLATACRMEDPSKPDFLYATQAERQDAATAPTPDADATTTPDGTPATDETASDTTTDDTAADDLGPDTAPDAAADTSPADTQPADIPPTCSPTDCDESNPCTADTCTAGQCSHEAANEALACSDNNACTSSDACAAGTCKGKALDCNDGNPCTGDGCDAVTGCTKAPLTGSACDDGDPCSVGDTCQTGTCSAGSPLACPSEKPCVAWACDSVIGKCKAAYKSAGTGCDDGNPCTTQDACDQGACAGTVGECDDGNPCTEDSCALATGCTATAADAKPCDDGSACTSDEACAAGACAGGTSKDCGDANPCTDDACDKKTGACSHLPNTAQCDDGNPCTADGGCKAGVCTGGSNSCSCQSDADCAGSEDGNACNGTLYCDKSAPPFQCQIKPGSVVVCDTVGDGPCAATTCAPKTGLCSKGPANEGGGCDADGSVCTQGDACSGGSCVAGTVLGCDDGNVCTTDVCDAVQGCVALNNTGPCSDGNLCTVGEACANGACGAGSPLVWDQTYGGSESEVAYAVAQTSDGGLVAAGSTNNGYAFRMLRTDATGKQLWSQTYTGAEEGAYAVVQTSDGGFALAGANNKVAYSDGWLMRTDANGAKLWDQSYTAAGNDVPRALIETSDGGFALAGYTDSKGFGSNDFWLVRTSPTGVKLWDKTYGGTNADYAYSVAQTKDGGFAIGGSTYSKGAGLSDFWLVRTDSSGNKLWDKTYGTAGYEDWGRLVLTADGGFAMTGDGATKGSAAFWLVRADANGNKIWDQYFVGGVAETVQLKQIGDGGFAVAGYTNTKGAGGLDMQVIRTDANGNKLWDRTYGGVGDDRAYAVTTVGKTGLAVAGSTTSKGAGGTDFWLLRMDLWGNTTCSGSGLCVGYDDATCDDGNQCTLDFCSPSTGCGHSIWPNSTPCDAGDPCTLGDVCSSGACIAGWPKLYGKTHGGTGSDQANAVAALSDGGSALAGMTTSVAVAGSWPVKSAQRTWPADKRPWVLPTAGWSAPTAVAA